MKVLHVAPYFLPATEWGGPVRSLAALASGQRHAGHHVEVATTNARGSAALVPQPPGPRVVDGHTVTFHAVRYSPRFAYAPSLGEDLASRVARADVVHIHGLWTYPTLAASRACRAARVPYVLSPRGMLRTWALSHKSLKKRVWAALVEDRGILGAAVLHYTSEAEARETPARYRAIPGAVVPNPIELDDLLGLPEAGPSTFSLLVCGRVHPVKGFDLLIPALAALGRRGLEPLVVVAGSDEGGYRSEVERLARDHGVAERLRFTGDLGRAALVQAYAGASALVMPSYQENFGMSAAEAMAAARPVIASREVGIAPEIERAGAGLVVGLRAGELADAVEALAGDAERRRRMGRAGRALVRARYSPEAVAARMDQVYREALAG